MNCFGPLLAAAILAFVVGRYLLFLKQGQWYRGQRPDVQEGLNRYDRNWGMYHGGEMGIFQWILGLALGGGMLVYLVGRELGFFGK
jgi:hypothetical protein